MAASDSVSEADRGGVLLTGVGKRYDIVSAFAQHAAVVAADPNPLAPAQYAAHHRYSVPRIDDPGYVSALAELCDRHDVGPDAAPEVPDLRKSVAKPFDLLGAGDPFAKEQEQVLAVDLKIRVRGHAGIGAGSERKPEEPEWPRQPG